MNSCTVALEDAEPPPTPKPKLDARRMAPLKTAAFFLEEELIGCRVRRFGKKLRVESGH